MRALAIILPLALAACGRSGAEAPEKAAAAPSAVPAPAAPTADAAAAAVGLPADVEAQRRNAETCEHFAGEEPYDAERRRQIEQGLADSCGPLKAALPGLKAKHAGDPAVDAMLADWDELVRGYGG